MTIRLLIADDREIVRTGIRAMLFGSELEVTAIATSGSEATRLVREREFDLLLMREQLDSHVANDAFAQIKTNRPELPIVLLGTPSSLHVDGARDCRSTPHVLLRIREDDTRGRLIAGLYAALGRDVPCENVAPDATTHTNCECCTTDVTLTHRELEVLRQMVRGLTNKQIAETLKISTETVKEHVRHLLRKLEVSDRTQAAVWAVRHGLG